jgi:hypothetical protein
MAFVHGLGQRIRNPRANPDHRRPFETALAGRNGGGVADHGHDVAMPASLGAQNAKPFSVLL